MQNHTDKSKYRDAEPGDFKKLIEGKIIAAKEELNELLA